MATFVAAHPGARFVFAGDFLDPVADAPNVPRPRAMRAIFARHPAATRALRRALDTGSEVVLLSGNHDDAIGHRELRPTLRQALTHNHASRQRLSVSPWFWRRGALHVEHGHLYDPDNAPEHPLICGQRSLGVHFSASFIHPTQAHRYLQNNDDMPLALLLAAFRWYGWRAPHVIYRYLVTAVTALARSGPYYRAAAEGQLGATQQAHFAAAAGVPQDMLQKLLAGRATPTLRSWSHTFARMYLDRLLSTALAGAGVSLTLSGRPRRGLSLATLGGLLLTLNWAHQRNRYAGSVVARLTAAASRIHRTTGAALVVFGHAHREALNDHYANTASFAYPRRAPGRPLIEVDTTSSGPRAIRRHWLASGQLR